MAQKAPAFQSVGSCPDSLKAVFVVPKYVDIPDQDWPRVVQWFRAQVEQWQKSDALSNDV